MAVAIIQLPDYISNYGGGDYCNNLVSDTGSPSGGKREKMRRFLESASRVDKPLRHVFLGFLPQGACEVGVVVVDDDNGILRHKII